MNVVLHVCCGVCAAGAVDKLIPENHQFAGYFFNPNLDTFEEYNRRLEAAETIARSMNFTLVDVTYNPEEWLKSASSLSAEPEGGKRCAVCFRIRLQKTYEYMQKIGYDAFTTTLTVGAQKSADLINSIGKEIGGDKFLARDFKKQGGSQRANELAKQSGIYRQNYCGCIYSKRTF